MSNDIGAYEARVRLGELLKRVASGERFTITSRGVAVAELVPASRGGSVAVRAAVAAMQRIEPIQGVSTRELLAMIGEGRR